jgi:hypothetical protein
MGISPIGDGTSQTTTITIPGSYSAGDFILIAASRANTNAPTVPSGWATLAASGGSGVSSAIAWKLAQSSSETSGTWTNAQLINCVVLRGSAGVIYAGPTITATAANSATITYGALGQYRAGVSDNIYLGHACQLNTANSLETAPSGMANVNFDSVTGLKAALHASPTQLSNWASTTVGPLANVAVFRSVVIQLQEIEAPAFGGGGIFFRPGPSGGMSE